MIPYGRQDISEADVEAVCEVLRSDWLTQGPCIEAFETAMCRYCDAGYAVAATNATAALHLACLALDVGPGDWVWTSPNTFVASANCARYCGAQVDFVDIDPETYNLCPAALERKLEVAAAAARLPKVVIPVHFAGQSCDMVAIRALADRYGFRIIEDASHAVGGQYQGRPVGCGAYADVTIFSFHPVKIITTGEGGMALTNDPGICRRMRRLGSHGITRDPQIMPGPAQGPWDYQQVELGFNYRITDIQAALGLSQMARLDSFVARRQALADRYDAALERLPVVRPHRSEDSHSAMHLYVIQVGLDHVRGETNISRGVVFDRLRDAGVGVNVHYIPVHTQPYYRALGFATGDFPVAEAYYSRAITLPLFATLSDSDQGHVIAELESALT